MTTGVYLHRKTGKYAAQISRDGVRYYLGLHSTPQAAAEVRAAFESTLPQRNPVAGPAPSGPITQARVRELFDYSEETGILTWKARTSRRVSVGQPVSHINVNGYPAARVDGKAYLVHRLVWMYIHGRFPDQELDHRDGNRANNRLDNLREATRAQNVQNYGLRSDNALGHTGVYKNKKTGKFDAQVVQGGRIRYRSSFVTLDMAVAARAQAKAKYHTFQPVQRCT